MSVTGASGALYAVQFLRRRFIHQVEQPGKRVAQREAAAAAVADVEDPLHLLLDRGGIIKFRILPGDRMPGGGVEAAFSQQVFFQ